MAGSANQSAGSRAACDPPAAVAALAHRHARMRARRRHYFSS